MKKSTAGAGRGKQGGPTAKELEKHEREEYGDVYTAEMGQPPMDPEVAPPTPKVRRMGKDGGEVGKSWNDMFKK